MRRASRRVLCSYLSLPPAALLAHTHPKQTQVTEAPTYLATHDRTSPPPDQGVYRRQKGSHPRLQTHAHPCPSKARPAAVVGTETTNIILRHFRQLAEVRARVRGPRRSRSPNARLSPSQKQRERQKRAPPAAEAARKTAKLARPTSQ